MSAWQLLLACGLPLRVEAKREVMSAATVPGTARLLYALRLALCLSLLEALWLGRKKPKPWLLREHCSQHKVAAGSSQEQPIPVPVSFVFVSAVQAGVIDKDRMSFN